MTRNIVLIHVIGLFILSTVFAPAADSQTTTGCEAPAYINEVVQDLNSLYRTQQTDGSLEFNGPFGFFENYPVLAALTLNVHRKQPNPGFASRSTAAVVRYYSHLFTKYDKNANMLIETALAGKNGPAFERIEDPGFNSLLALDMICLAKLNLELRKPLQALYWYEGARILQEQIVAACYDPDSGYFFPFDPNAGALVREYHALSMAPLLFRGKVGDNHASTLIRHYVLAAGDYSPEPPSFFLLDSPAIETMSGPEYALKAAIVSEALETRGYPDEASRVLANAAINAGRAGTSTPRPKQSTATANYLACMPNGEKFRRLHDSYDALDIFGAIVRSKRRLADNEIVRLEENIRDIKHFCASTRTTAAGDFLTDSALSELETNAIESSIRAIFWTVFRTREQVDKNTLFDKEDSYKTSGLELQPAMTRLLDDVVSELRDVENNLFHAINRHTGLSISATLLDERPVYDQNLEVRWTIEAKRSMPVEIRSAEVFRGQEVDSLIRSGRSVKTGEPASIRPGEPKTFVSNFPAASKGPGTLLPCDFSLILTDGNGRRMRYNASRTVYLEQPIRITTTFPKGKILRDFSLPIDIHFDKNTASHVQINGGWYSPSGLQLNGGNGFEFSMSPSQDSTTVRIEVLVPSPCRPGSFPFKIKFWGNGKDLGMIESAFFKSYEWLFVGPFEATVHALDVPYPPEGAVDLQSGYSGIGKQITWQVLPETTNRGFGEVLLGSTFAPSGVGYLYTVLESSIEKQCPAFLASNGPAALFFNGERVLDYRPDTNRGAASVQVPVRRGRNNILVKVVGNRTARVFFKLGDDNNLASDEFNNNLWELVTDYDEFQERSVRLRPGETHEVQKLVTLRYADSEAHSVSVIGTFNGWSPEHSRMQRAKNGTWEITLSLLPGKYAYRFLVNNRKQVLDPRCSDEEPDGYGGTNSIIYVKK